MQVCNAGRFFFAIFHILNMFDKQCLFVSSVVVRKPSLLQISRARKPYFSANKVFAGMDAAAEGQLEGQGEIETTLQYFCLKYSIFFEAILENRILR